MIHYSLICEDGHKSEGWFRSSDDFDVQAAGGLISCPLCGSQSVTKALMAPAVASGKVTRDSERKEEKLAEMASDKTEKVPAKAKASEVVLSDPAIQQAIQTIREIKKAITDNAEYVGSKFAEEARKIHHEEADQRGIYGEATSDDVKSLLEDGIDILPLPVLPEDHH
ncbi:MAG: DUF1178 family protein [Cohaesibacteraceae bacterium]|nr:DUF1178 family protein [Cohaesibacteraceae bacterium]MBL4875283.1 DUF1178 family protein [Cohaesibacteraceae bacterium]